MTSIHHQLPRLSVIVPVFNAERTIERCLSFLLNQSLKDMEIICVDDNSLDSSRKILDAYQSKYPQKIICTATETRQGPGGARNVGLSHARGMYVGFVDSDDWVDSSLYRTVVDTAIRTEADIAIFGVKDEFDGLAASPTRYDYRALNSITHSFALRLLSRTYDNDTFISPMVCQKIYKHDFLTQNGLRFKADSYFEDDLFTFQCFLHEGTAVTVPGVFYHYYQRHDSITHTFSKKHIDDLITLIKDLKNALESANAWIYYEPDYYSFCSKCVRSTANALFCAEPRIKNQKRYLSYLLSQLQTVNSLDDWLDHIDISVLKQVFGYMP